VVWDLAMRDLPNAGTGAAWSIVDRLWYLSRSTATSAFACVKTTSPWTSNGCSTGSMWRVFRAIDDDDGNLTNGTPHGAALYAAFNRHGLACTTDAGASTTFAGCTAPATPALSLAAADYAVNASWSGSTGVYDLYRNETGCNAGFVKVGNDLTGTTYSDTGVANGTTYYYQLVAQPSGNEACASAPSSCQSVTPAGAPCTPPAAPTGVTATVASATQINLSWTAASGATEYRIYRATTSGGPYTQVGTATGTTFSNTGLTCNTAYYYVVRSYASCESGNSTQASGTTSACTGNVLTNGVAVTGLSGATGSQQTWTMAVPAGASNLSFVTAGGTGVTSFNVRTQAYVQAASSNAAVVGTNIPIYTPAALTGALTTGWKYFDSSWVNLTALATNIAGYGWSILRPRYRWDHNGSVAPTVANLSTILMTRIA
jgi:hypothetical protein